MRDIGILGAKLSRVASHLPYVPMALRLVWSAAPGWTTASVAVLVGQGLQPVANVYLVKLLVDSLSGMPTLPLPILVGLLAATILLGEVLRSLGSWVRTAQSELVRDHVTGLIHEQSIAIDMAFYESPDYFDQLFRARTEAPYRALALLDGLGGLLQGIVVLVGMLVVLLPFGGLVLGTLALSGVPYLYVFLSHTVRQHHWRLRTTADERRARYYDWLMTEPEVAAELRVFSLGGRFKEVYEAIRGRLRGERVAFARSQGIDETLAATLSLGTVGLALAWVARQSAAGAITLGSTVLFYQSVLQLQRTMRTSLEHVARVYENTLFLGGLFAFLRLDSTVVGGAVRRPPALPLQQGIRFRNVTFGYPGTKRRALRDFDLAIGAGQMVAIVGFNGAGKSTLVKLLCRLYDPEQGSVEMDGVDLREMDLGDLRASVAVLFQRPVHYSATVTENIALRAPDAGTPESVRRTAAAAGAQPFIHKLPGGYDNLLGKWFDGGADLSVGEWQRLALARALHADAAVVVLDEPTSAMDPWSEADWLPRFRHAAAGRTAVLITHRFSTARHADVIHVMDEGRVVESGTHAELVAAGQLYAKSWASQSQLDDGATK